MPTGCPRVADAVRHRAGGVRPDRAEAGPGSGRALLDQSATALPQLDAVGLYRWNGLDGELPGGANLPGPPGPFNDWTLGVNFSVPLGLRQSRAGLRRTELVIARDRANLQQGLHAAVHTLATSVRAIDVPSIQGRRPAGLPPQPPSATGRLAPAASSFSTSSRPSQVGGMP
jgi:hypothetical protein